MGRIYYIVNDITHKIQRKLDTKIFLLQNILYSICSTVFLGFGQIFVIKGALGESNYGK
jgi:hypothetical protein